MSRTYHIIVTPPPSQTRTHSPTHPPALPAILPSYMRLCSGVETLYQAVAHVCVALGFTATTAGALECLTDVVSVTAYS